MSTSFDQHASLPPAPGQRKSLADELKDRLANRPDPYTIAWWKSQWDEAQAKWEELLKAYRGMCHSVNIAIANTRDNEAKLAKFGTVIEELRNENAMVQMLAGELQTELAEMREEREIIKKRIADMAAWAARKGKQLPDESSVN